MLVLSRKKEEQILIGDHIVLTVVTIQGGKVRLGIDAPRDVPVTRPQQSKTKPGRPGKQDADDGR